MSTAKDLETPNELFGISSESGVDLYPEDDIEILMDDRPMIIHGETLTHDEDFQFKYAYMIENTVFFDREEFFDREDNHQELYSLQMVLHPDSFCESVKREACRVYGREDDLDSMTYYESKEFGITLSEENFQSVHDYDKAMAIMRTGLSFAYSAIDSMRGFYLDERLNKIGTTGWDFIRYILGESDDLYLF